MLLAAASCDMKESLDAGLGAKVIEITSVEATYCPEDVVRVLDGGATVSEPVTKTVRQSDGSVWWSPDDDISLFFGGSQSRFVATITDDSPTAQFSGYLSAVVGGGEGVGDQSYFYGIYPYDPYATVSNGRVTTTLPAEQEAVAGTFAQGTFVTLARSTHTGLSFYNLCGGFKFKVSHNGIKKIVLEGRNNEYIAGTAQIAFDGNKPMVYSIVDGSKSVTLSAPEGEYFETGKYYFVVIFPTTFSQGLTMTFYTDDEKGVLTRTSSTTIPRSSFGVFSNADKTVTYDPYLDPSITTYDYTVNVKGCTFESQYKFDVIRHADTFYFGLHLKAGYTSLAYLNVTMDDIDVTDYVIPEGDPELYWFPGDGVVDEGYYFSIPAVGGDVVITARATRSANVDYNYGGEIGD